VGADPPLRSLRIRIVAVVQDHQTLLNNTSTALSSGPALGKLIQCNFSSRIVRRVLRRLRGLVRSLSKLTHTSFCGYQCRTHRMKRYVRHPYWNRRLSGHGLHIIQSEQIEKAARLWVPFQHQPFRRCVAPSTVRFHGDWFNVEKEHCVVT